jgi:hypothetical protein
VRFSASDPADVAARLRHRIAQHEEDRRTRRALIRALDAFIHDLKVRNTMAARLVGRLRRAAAEYEADAERARQQRRLVITTKCREAA